jgi:hypothetical protein
MIKLGSYWHGLIVGLTLGSVLAFAFVAAVWEQLSPLWIVAAVLCNLLGAIILAGVKREKADQAPKAAAGGTP